MFARYLKIILSVTETLNLPQLIKEEKMSNNKFLKKLLAIGVASVSAISVFGLAACNPDDGNDNGDGPNPGPGTPTQLATPSITLNSESKKITWNAIDHATGYKVYEKASTASSATEKTTVTACEYTITQTAVGSYDYYVVATSTSDDYSDSKNSNTVTYTVSEDTPPVQETVYDILAKDPKNIIAEDFSTTTTIEKNSGFKGVPGIYWNRNEKGNATDTTNTVKVESGHAVVVDTSDGGTELLIDFGQAKGTVNAYYEVKLSGSGSKWTLFQLFGTNDSKTNAEIFGVRTADSGTGVKYRLNGGSNQDPLNSVTLNDTDTFGVYWKIDLDTHKITLSIDDKAIVTDLDIGVTGLQGIKLVTSDTGSKTFAEVDNIAVVAEQATVAEYAEAQAAKFEAKYSDLTDAELGDLSTDVPVATHKNNIASATSYAEVDAAYKAGVSACDAQILANAKAAAKSQITNYSEEGYTGAQLEALQAAKTTANANIDTATSVADVKAKLAEGKEALDAVEDDAAAAVATITIQVIAVLEGELKNRIGELTTKSGVAVTVEQIEAACELGGYNLLGFYEDQECIANPIEESYTKSSETELTVTIYAKVAAADKVLVEHTLDASVVMSVAGIGGGSSKEYSTSNPSPSMAGFTIINKISTKNSGGNLSFANQGDVAKFTTSADSMTFKIKFQSNKSDGSRSMTITGPNSYSYTFDYKTKDQDLEITLGNAGEYTISTAGGEIAFYYMSYTNMEFPAAGAATLANVSDLEVILPESKNY